jgi:peptidoglycan/xylan/chitin deacetylase (PgdA/CDA1 family)
MTNRRTLIAAAVAGVLAPTFGVAACGRPSASSARFVPVDVPAGTSSASLGPTGSPSAAASPSAATSHKPAASPPLKRVPQTQATGHGPAGSQSVTGNMSVALTFDDGPDPVYTPQMLSLLRQYGVKATFSVIGSRARDYPDLIRQIAADGHTLCSHSWQHLLDLAMRDPTYRDWDLTQTNLAIQKAVPGLTQVKYFRAPGGNFTTDLVTEASGLGMKSIYWTVDPRDWDSATYGTGSTMVNHIVSTVQANARPGAIILSHDRAHPDTIAAYKILLPWLLAQNYDLVAL